MNGGQPNRLRSAGKEKVQQKLKEVITWPANTDFCVPLRAVIVFHFGEILLEAILMLRDIHLSLATPIPSWQPDFSPARF